MATKTKKKPKRRTRSPTPDRSKKKKKLPCDLDADFLEEVKDAVVFMQRGPEPQTSIRSFVQDALVGHMELIRSKHAALLTKTKGKIPSRPKNASPRVGRPMNPPAN